MSELSRRGVLGAAAASSVIAAAPQAVAQAQPPHGPAPPLLAGAELPSFRFRLGAATPKSWDGGWAKEATVKEFPVSQSIAGVLVSLAPGGLRELHWHANAAEWAYVNKGRPHGLSVRWQATLWPAVVVRSSGSCVRQIDMTCGQRV